MNNSITNAEYSHVLESIGTSGSRHLLNISEVASRLGCGKTLAYKLVTEGRIRSIKLGRLTRIPDTAVEQFIDAQLALGEYQ